MNLIGNKVILRAIEKEDMPFLQEMINDPEIEKNVVGWSFPTNKNMQEKWFEALSDTSIVRYAINVDNQFIGTIILHDIDWKNRSAEISIKLLNREEFRRKGYAKETVKLLLKYSFEQLNLNRIVVKILETNINSRKLFEKCAFTFEGKSIKAVFKNGEYVNLMNYYILKENYID